MSLCEEHFKLYILTLLLPSPNSLRETITNCEYMIDVTDSHSLTLIIARLITGHIVKENEFYYMKLI